MATINDVCRAAGVSKATVSRVINGTGQVSERTRLKVEAVMQELKYRPSSVAQALANQSGNSIGLVISDFTGNYFGSLLKQASISAEAMGKQLLFADGHNNAEDELRAVYSLVEKKCDVIVLYSRMLSSEQVIALNRSIDVPLVNVGRQLPIEAGYSIAFDQKHAIRLATEHLINLGHNQITYIGPNPITPTALMRYAGFKEVIAMYHGAEGGYVESQFGYIEGYNAAISWLDNHTPTSAIVTAADDIAVGCIKAFREHGLRVPEDVSIVSIDNDPCAPFATPPLSTVEIPIAFITSRAIEVAKLLIEKNITEAPEIIQGDLIIRDSVMRK